MFRKIKTKGIDLTQSYDKVPKPTESFKRQSDKTKTPAQSSITQLLRTDLQRSVAVNTATRLL